MEDICATRAIKNARYIQRVAPHIIPPEEPIEGFTSIVPFDILSNFHRLKPSDLAHRPDLRALLDSGKQPKLAQFSFLKAPLFMGTLHFVRMIFNTNTKGGGAKGQISVSTADVKTAIQYAKLAVNPISAYASQYGKNSLSVSPAMLQHSVNLATTQYTDDMLRVWVNDIVLENILPDKSTCLVILNPKGITNSDGDLAQKVGAYHDNDIVPYCFVNVKGSSLTIDDRQFKYAQFLSHEIAEMVVDPTVDHTNPEVCDPCGPNCPPMLLDFFGGIDSSYVQTVTFKKGTPFPPAFPFTFYINAIVQPDSASQCPAPSASCAYSPPGVFGRHPRFLVDLTGPGHADIVGFGDGGVWVSLNNGNGIFQAPQVVLGSFGYNTDAGEWRVEKHPRFLADLTGPGHADIVGFGDRGVWVSLNNGNGTFQSAGTEPVLQSFGYNDDAGGWRVEKHPRFLADLRSAGHADIVGFGDRGVWVALNNGHGTFQSAGTEPVLKSFGYNDDAGGWRVEKHPRFLADLTGDGRADIVGFGDRGVWVALNNGDGTFQSAGTEPVLKSFGYNHDAGGWRVEKHPRFLVDLTGDGRADIVGFGDRGVWVALNNGDGTFHAPQLGSPELRA